MASRNGKEKSWFKGRIPRVKLCQMAAVLSKSYYFFVNFGCFKSYTENVYTLSRVNAIVLRFGISKWDLEFNFSF